MKIQETISKEFDKFSSDYTQDMINCVPYYQPLLQSMSQCISDGMPAKRILDLGSGNGNVTELFSKRYPQAHFTLIDASPEMLNICSTRFKGLDISTVESYFDQYVFPEDHFDIVSAGFSLHHVNGESKKDLFKKVYSSLREEGVFVCADLMINKSHMDHPSLLVEWESFVKSNYPDDQKWIWIMDHYDAFDQPDHFLDQVKWLKEAGFRQIEFPFQQGFWRQLKATK